MTNGFPQGPTGLIVPNGSISLSLNIDATVIATPGGFVSASIPAVFQFNTAGQLASGSKIWSNEELNPQNNIGLGTYYLVTFYDANGAVINKTPMWWQFTEVNGATVDISTMAPFSTVGGNVIFYPTSFAIPEPTPTSLGGVFSNVGASHMWVSTINTDGTVNLSQPSFADISGTISPTQLPNPLTFSTITATGLITAEDGIQVGLTGTTSGQITLEGSTSGAATLTAPAVAGTITNPITVSNSLQIPSGTVYSINGDTSISRISAGVLAIGNGTAGDTSGTLEVANIKPAVLMATTLATATQPTFRSLDSELTLGSTVTSVSGSVAALRGNTILASGGTITGASYLYGTQGKLTIQGALNSSAEVSCGLLGQLDLSMASASSGPITAGWFDCGATASAAIISSPAAIDGVVIYNTTNAIINSVLRTAANANYLIDATDLAYGGQHFVQLSSVNTGDLANVKLKVHIGGSDYYLPLYTN